MYNLLNPSDQLLLLFCLVDCMKNGPFALAIDDSSDSGIEKMNPLTIRFCDVSASKVVTQFLDMCMSSSSTAEGIL